MQSRIAVERLLWFWEVGLRFRRNSIGVSSLVLLLFTNSIFLSSSHATVDEQKEIPALECGLNHGKVSDHFKYYGLMVNLGSHEKNDAAAKTYCSERGATFEKKCEKIKAAYEARECPARCRNARTGNSSSQSTIFGFEQKQHSGESDAAWKSRRDRAIDKVMSQGECGSSEDSRATCKRLIEDGSFTIFICLGDWSFNWSVICD